MKSYAQQLSLSAFGSAAVLALVLGTGSTSLADNHSGTFSVDTSASSVAWKGDKVVGSGHDGEIRFKSGSVEVKGGKIVGGSFVVDMNTMTNKDLASSPKDMEKLVGHLKSPDFFDVKKFPEATFKITSVETKSPTEIVLKGDFTMIGKTQPIEVPAKIQITATEARGEAVVKLDRTRWDLKYGSGKFFPSLVQDRIIRDEFELKFNLVAKAAAPAAGDAKRPSGKKK